MTINLKTKLVKLSNIGTKQEIFISKRLLKNPKLEFKNIQELSEIFKCSNSSITRFVNSLKLPSFKHFYVEWHNIQEANFSHENNDVVWYEKHAKEIASLINGNIYTFCSRRGKAIAKFFNERLNSVDFPNHLFHESWGETIEEQVAKVTTNDTAILFTLNGESNLATKIIEQLKKSDNVSKIIILTYSNRKITHEKITKFSLSEIDNVEYNLDSFDGYNFASARMISLVASILKEININKKN